MTRLTAAAAVAAALSLAAPAVGQTTLSLGHALGPGSHYSVGAVAFKETLERLSDGRFLVEEHPSSALGGERDMIEGLQIGSVDLVITSTGPLGNFVPEVLVLDLPFLFRDYGHARRTLDGEIGQELLAAIDENDLVGLAWSENGFRHVTNSVRPVATPADLAGLKLRTMENRVHMQAFEALGAAPTPMAWPEVFPALQQRVVDGQENPITVITAANLDEVQGYLSLTGHVYSPAAVLASPLVLEGLTDEERGWFYEAGRASAAATRAKVDELEETGVALLRERGMEVTTDIDKTPFQELAAASYEAFVAENGDEMIIRIMSVE